MVAQGLSEQPHHTTAFIGDPGNIDILVSYSSYKTDHFWNKHGERLDTFNDFHRKSAMLYVEYAFNCNNAFWLNGGWARSDESMNGHSNAVEDIEFGWKHLLYGTETSSLTSQLIAIIPMGDRKSSIRYGKCGFEADLLYSDTYNLFNRCGWYDLGLGYRVYEGYPSDQVRAQAAIGYCISCRFAVIASCNLDYGVFNGHCLHNTNNIVFNPNYRLFEGSIEGVYRLFSHVAVSFGGFKHFWGENVGAGGGLYGGTWIDF